MFPLRRRQYSCTLKVVEFTDSPIHRFTNSPIHRFTVQFLNKCKNLLTNVYVFYVLSGSIEIFTTFAPDLDII